MLRQMEEIRERLDWPPGIEYKNGTMSLPETSLWG
jgi:hypothetical protein